MEFYKSELIFYKNGYPFTINEKKGSQKIIISYYLKHIGTQFMVIIFNELEKNSLRKGGIANVFEKVVN